MPKHIATYLRVSSKSQDVASQARSVHEFAGGPHDDHDVSARPQPRADSRGAGQAVRDALMAPRGSKDSDYRIAIGCGLWVTLRAGARQHES